MLRYAFTAGAETALKKYALFGHKKDTLEEAAPYVLGAGIPLATIGGLLLSKPGVQSALRNALHTGNADVHTQDLSTELPAGAVATARRVKQELLARGIDPASLRMAVDAPPGTGKTTLSRAIAQETGMKHYGLDWLPHNTWTAVTGGSNIEQMPRPPRAGEILEHYNLLRGYDPEVFDAAIHIKKPGKTIKKQVLKRGRSAYTADFIDYDKANRVGALAFDTLAGDTIDLGNDTYLKLRPREGWGNQLDTALATKGINAADLDRHSKLLSLDAGKRTEGGGWKPYAKNPLSAPEMGLALGSIPLGLAAAHAATKAFG